MKSRMQESGKPMKHPDHEGITYGDRSLPLWDDINAVKGKSARMAVYALGCRCQELEAMLRKAMARVEALERGFAVLLGGDAAGEGRADRQ